MADEQSFVSRHRSDLRTFLNAWETLIGNLGEYDRLGSASNPDLDTVSYDDIDKAKFVATFTSISNLKVLIDGADGTNLYEGASS
jgi:hypothetical protein